MFKSKQIKFIFPIFATLIFSGFSQDESSQYMNGLSPYYSAAIHFEEKAFFKIVQMENLKTIAVRETEEQKIIWVREENRKIQLSYENKVKTKIRQVISTYQLQMDADHIQKIPESILQESKTYDYDPMFLTALIIVESSFNSKAQSSRGAIGLMQIVPRTGMALATEKKMEWKGNPTLYNPQTNIALGAYYLNKLKIRFGNFDLALEAYNHGPTILTKYLKRGYQPRRYSNKVFQIYEMIDFEPT